MRGLCLFLLLCGVGLGQAPDAWGFQPDVDLLTRVDRSFVFTQDTAGSRATLVVRCSGDAPQIYLTGDDFYGTRDPLRVEYRLDDRGIAADRWAPAAPGTLALAPAYLTGPYLRDWLGGQSLVVRVTGYDGRAYTYAFSLSGLEGAANRLGCFRRFYPALLAPPPGASPGVRYVRVADLAMLGRLALPLPRTVLDSETVWFGPEEVRLPARVFKTATDTFIPLEAYNSGGCAVAPAPRSPLWATIRCKAQAVEVPVYAW